MTPHSCLSSCIVTELSYQLPGRAVAAGSWMLNLQARPGHRDTLSGCAQSVGDAAGCLNPPGHRTPGIGLANRSGRKAPGRPAGQLLAAGSGCHVAEAAFCYSARLSPCLGGTEGNEEWPPFPDLCQCQCPCSFSGSRSHQLHILFLFPSLLTSSLQVCLSTHCHNCALHIDTFARTLDHSPL